MEVGHLYVTEGDSRQLHTGFRSYVELGKVKQDKDIYLPTSTFTFHVQTK
jgi:hypothetical protein